jgi:oligopeptide transport system substrate-binding protein
MPRSRELLDAQGLVARGLYPPALPGYNRELKGLEYDPKLAHQRLAESKYGTKLPPITFTIIGLGQ